MIRTLFILFLLIIYSSPIPGGAGSPLSKNTIFEIEKICFYIDIKNKDFSEDLLIKSFYYEKIQYPEIVILQAQLETGYYTSDVFLNGHNLFGMKYPAKRETIAIGEYQGHAQYNHWSDSVKDYKIWQNWYLSQGYRIQGINDSNFYLVFLKCIQYAKDPQYIHKLVYLNQKNIT